MKIKIIKTTSLSLILSSILAFGWEVNTHRAIDRCAISDECGQDRAKNLHNFVEDMGIKNENYKNEKFEGYTLIEPNENATYFNYIESDRGERNSLALWGQTFSKYNYQDLIEAGTILEDALWEEINKEVDSSSDIDGAKGRFNYHFYDANNNGAGLTDYIYKSCSEANENLVNWAENGINSILNSPVWCVNESHTNQYSYKSALEYYRKGFAEQNATERKKYRAKMFVSLGFLLHLLNDTNVPAHTRNDAHNPDPLEYWMRGGEDGAAAGGFKIRGNILNYDDRIFTAVKNIPIFKYNKATSFRDFYINEAEFTGQNFFSEDTIKKSGYLPQGSEPSDKEGYITSIHPDINSTHNKLAIKEEKGILWGYNYYIQKGNNNNVLIDNGINLIPRAVSNAEGFINYFFRGRMDASLRDGNLTIKNVSNPNLVADGNVIFKKGGDFTLYYETDKNETKLLGNHSFVLTSDFDVNKTVSYDISNELDSIKNNIGKSNKITIIYGGQIGETDGVSIAIAKKLTNVDVLFSFDKSGSMGSDIENAKNSAKDILGSIIGADNNSTYIQIEAFNSYASVLLPYDNNVTKVKAKIDTIYSGGGTALYDAIKLAGDNAVAHKNTSGISKSIVILYTDGQENRSSTSRQAAIDAISNAKASTIDEVFLIFVGSDTTGEAQLKSIADDAGRKFMSVSNASGLKDAIEKILKGQ